MFDIFLFSTHYTTLQFCGIGFLFCLYIGQGLKFLLYDMPKEKRRTEAKKREVERIDEQAMALVVLGAEEKVNLEVTLDGSK
mmetsp:Transcript_35636/g.43650  ORF Transcript_35636/g.43650 Transcript_35636/m.43650 type:complete len:82 (+) Transcript_35636:740-985(+)